MNSRERVSRALGREGLPDRAPLQSHLSRQLVERHSKEYGLEPQYTTSYHEDVIHRLSANDLRGVVGSDCVIVGDGLLRGYSHTVDENGHVTNEFSMAMRHGPLHGGP